MLQPGDRGATPERTGGQSGEFYQPEAARIEALAGAPPRSRRKPKNSYAAWRIWSRMSGSKFRFGSQEEATGSLNASQALLPRQSQSTQCDALH
jgi:hypothetical protein